VLVFVNTSEPRRTLSLRKPTGPNRIIDRFVSSVLARLNIYDGPPLFPLFAGLFISMLLLAPPTLPLPVYELLRARLSTSFPNSH